MTHLFRTTTRALALALLGLTGACSEAGVSTAPAVPLPEAAPRRVMWAVGDTVFATFTYSPASSLRQAFGSDVELSMPAGAVCAAGSGYGAGTWDSPCATRTQSIEFKVAAWRDGAGRPRLVITPDVRFVPGKVVTLRLRDTEAATKLLGTIGWCPTGSITCVDESATDASMSTKYDPSTGWVYRRLKHFSGYHIVFRSDESAETY